MERVEVMYWLDKKHGGVVLLVEQIVWDRLDLLVWVGL